MEFKSLERILTDFKQHLTALNEFPELQEIYSVLESNLDRPLTEEEHLKISGLYSRVCYKGGRNAELELVRKKRAEYDLLLIRTEVLQFPEPEEFGFASFWKRKASRSKLKKIIKKLREYQKLCELNGKTLQYLALECDRGIDKYEWRLRLTEIHGGLFNAVDEFIEWCKKRV